MYVHEAHPNPDTAPCGSTEELGWNHPSWNTTSLGHRAQRARWLKEDFDLNFPWIMDTMNGAIWFAYGGSGFYAGFVIDCDGEVLAAERWGWATPETQWCGLNLPPLTELTSLLDQYLSDPPACYRGVVPGPAVSIVPTAAHLEGANQTSWRTDLTLANPGDEAVEATVFLQRRDHANHDPESRSYEVPAGATLTLPDVLMTDFELTGAAALRVESATPLVMVSRTYNDTPEGTFGQWIPGIPKARAIGSSGVGNLPMLEETAGFRTNLGLSSLSAEEVHVRVFVTAGDGQLLGDFNIDLQPYGHVQLNQFLRDFSETSVAAARATVSVTTSGGEGVWAKMTSSRGGSMMMARPPVSTPHS